MLGCGVSLGSARRGSMGFGIETDLSLNLSYTAFKTVK